MSAIWQRIWVIARPILTNPATWTALISILGSLFGVPMLAPAPSVTLPQTLSVKPMAVVPLPVSHSSLWTSALDIDHDSPDAQIFTLQGGQPAIQFPTAGTYRVHAHLARLGKMGHAHMTVQVGDAPNPPPGPNPPGPGPEPPTPPAPIPAKGLHVLIVIDTANLSKLPPAQVESLTADAVRQYLNAACAAGPDGKTKEWRIWDAQGDVSHESQLWQDAFKRAAGKQLPWVIISNPDHGGGFEGPLPADADKLLALLKQFGG